MSETSKSEITNPETSQTSHPETSHPESTGPTLYGGPANRRVTVRHVQQAKERGERWGMLTAYDQLTAEIFDQAGIPVLLVGDSAANNVFGYPDTMAITMDELLPLARAVVRGTSRALVVADLPFGSYQLSPEQALSSAIRFAKEAGAHAVKLEGGRRVAPHVRAIVDAGIPVMAHAGFTPQSVHALGGYRVQGRGEQGDRMVEDARCLQRAGAFALVLELVPADVAKKITEELSIPTVGIGAGPDCDAQVLVWQDMAGMRSRPGPKFVKAYADLRGILTQAVRSYADEVRSGAYPAQEHSYQ